ncbi:MAG TPA: EamA/RhaT family transporter [Bacteroidia bacterium]
MFYLIVGIFCNLALLLLLKSFQKFNVASFPAIVINYFVAGGISLLFTNPKTVYLEATHLWLPSLALGALFVSIFYLISLTIETNGISVTTVANKMSVVIPVILAFIIYKDSPHLLKILGIILALLSVFLVSSASPPTPLQEERGAKVSRGRAVLPIAVFIGSGVIDAIVNYTQKKLVHSEVETACFIGLTFFAAGLIGVVAFMLFYKDKARLNMKRTLLAGIILGLPNYFSIYFIMKAINANFIESSVLYPLLNVSVVLGSTLGAYVFFSEKLSLKNRMGIALSVLAITLIALA